MATPSTSFVLRDAEAFRYYLAYVRGAARHVDRGAGDRHFPARVFALGPARCSAYLPGASWRATKTAHAAEQDRPDVLRQRWDWFEDQIDLDTDRMVFVDESWARTNTTRRHGRCPETSDCG